MGLVFIRCVCVFFYPVRFQTASTAIKNRSDLETSPMKMGQEEGKGSRGYKPLPQEEFRYNGGNPLTICTVFKLTVMTRAIKSTIYRGSDARFGSLTIPLRLSVLTRY